MLRPRPFYPAHHGGKITDAGPLHSFRKLVQVIFDRITDDRTVRHHDLRVTVRLDKAPVPVEKAPEPVHDILAPGIEDVAAAGVEKGSSYLPATDQSPGAVLFFIDRHLIAVPQ